ncbi:right-handed parallel beta-helix repeat-containing protein [Microbacterium paludicola]|uniref:right-handed parallel beta-helix repeat-containing protein n=1 Tax=Microbacterium paludicola TaxID=300019 RepID=UPI0031E2DAEF
MRWFWQRDRDASAEPQVAEDDVGGTRRDGDLIERGADGESETADVSRRLLIASLAAGAGAGAIGALVASGGADLVRDIAEPTAKGIGDPSPLLKGDFDSRSLQEYLGIFLPELHALEGDRDDQAIRRAAEAAAKAGGGTVLLTRSTYRFGASVALNGLYNVVFESRSGSVVTTQGPQPRLVAFAGNAGALDADGEPIGDQDGADITIRGITFDGGLANGGDLDAAPFYDFNANGDRIESGTGAFARTERAFKGSADARDGVMRAVYVMGDRDPASSSELRFTNVSVENVRLRGIEDLPIYLRGVRGLAAVDDSYAYRCLDIGFTYCENVRFSRNRIEYSADNGVSISRGNRNVTCSGNIIVKSFYFGIHLGGFNGETGPRNVSCTGNTVVQCGALGINLYDGPRDITITGNFISDIHRGHDDRKQQFQGYGILIRGGNGEPGKARNIVIVGNNIVRAHRAGVAVARDAEDVLVTGNSFQRIGLPRTPGGTPIPNDSPMWNFAIGKPGDKALHAKTVRRVVVTANAVFEDREAMLKSSLVRTVWRGGADITAVGNYASVGDDSAPAAVGEGGAAPQPFASVDDLGDASGYEAGTPAYDPQRRRLVISDGAVWRDADGAPAS